MGQTLQVNEKALSRIVDRLEISGCQYLRAGFKGGGCAGVTEYFEPTDNKKESDLEFDLGDAVIIMDLNSFELINNKASLEWSGNLLNRRLTWNFHGSKRTCSCGVSVSL